MSNGLTIAVVIRALNEAEHLPALLDGLAQQTQKPDQIILVDSGSTDESVALAAAAGAHIVSIRPEQFTFGRSLNVGCQAANADILVFVSAHVYPLHRNWLFNLVSPFTRSDVVLTYGRQTGDNRSRFSEVRLMEQWFPCASDIDQQIPFCNNANCAIRRSEWEKWPYDEELTGLEDLAWAKQALARGSKIAYQSDAVVVHVHDETFSRIRNRYRREAIAHKRIFAGHNLGTAETLVLFARAVFGDLVAAAKARQLRRSVLSIAVFRTGQYLGSWEGFRTRGPVSDKLKKRFYYPAG